MLTFEGTAGNDTLNAIYVPLGGTTIWYETDPTWDDLEGTWGDGIRDTGVAVPKATATIAIRINGYAGNDTVNFFGGAVATANMAGFPASSVSRLSFWGGNGNDILAPPEGTPGPPPVAGAIVLPGLGAPPNIAFYGEGGHDTLFNGEDPEYFVGDSGGDTVTVAGLGSGNDLLYGGPDIDIMDGGAGNDLIDGGLDADTLTGGTENDTIHGDAGNDTIDGGKGNDIITGGEGRDQIFGNDDDDQID